MSKSATAAAIEAEPEAPRQPPVLDPRAVVLDDIGQVFRRFAVYLPLDFVASDLAEPSIWSRVQKSSVALRKLDHLTLVAHDEGFVWTAFVSAAGPDFVTLSRPDRYELQARRTSYFEDDLFAVRWTGSGFSVARKSDGAVMRDGLPNETLAVRELQRLYPAPA